MLMFSNQDKSHNWHEGLTMSRSSCGPVLRQKVKVTRSTNCTPSMCMNHAAKRQRHDYKYNLLHQSTFRCQPISNSFYLPQTHNEPIVWASGAIPSSMLEVLDRLIDWLGFNVPLSTL